jgi:hypothetical protein
LRDTVSGSEPRELPWQAGARYQPSLPSPSRSHPSPSFSQPSPSLSQPSPSLSQPSPSLSQPSPSTLSHPYPSWPDIGVKKMDRMLKEKELKQREKNKDFGEYQNLFGLGNKSNSNQIIINDNYLLFYLLSYFTTGVQDQLFFY